jgi:hypothetical protein
LRTTGDYWGPAAEDAPLLHTWSLALEEQFYVLFPLATYLVFRLRACSQRFFLAVLFAFSGVAYGYARAAHPVAGFYLLPTRAWELSAGAWLPAAQPRSERTRTAWLDKSASAIAVATLLLAYSAPIFPFSREAVAVACAVAIIGFSNSTNAASWLGHSWLVHIGRISYSLYLWHWPVIVFARHLGFGHHKLPQWAVPYACGLASYVLVEKQTRNRPGILPWIGGAYAATVTPSASLFFTTGPLDTSGYAVPEWRGKQYSLEPRPAAADAHKFTGVHIPARDAPLDAYRQAGIIVPGEQDLPRIVVFGDSHGAMWAQAIREIAEESTTTISLWCMNGVRPTLNFPLGDDNRAPLRVLTVREKLSYDTARVDAIRKWKPSVVIVCQRWVIEKAADSQGFVTFLSQNAGHVLLMEQPPEIDAVGNNSLLQYLAFHRVLPRPRTKHYLPIHAQHLCEAARALVRDLAVKHSNVGIIPVYDLYERGSEALVLDGDEVVYLDDDHLTTYGTKLAQHRIREAIESCISSISGESDGGK